MYVYLFISRSVQYDNAVFGVFYLTMYIPSQVFKLNGNYICDNLMLIQNDKQSIYMCVCARAHVCVCVLPVMPLLFIQTVIVTAGVSLPPDIL